MTCPPVRLVACAAALLTAPSLTGCGSDENGDGVQVVAGFYALEYVAERVGGDRVDVTTVTQPGQEPHDAELTVARTAEVLEADLVLHAEGFQPALDEVAADASDEAVVDALDVLGSRDPAVRGTPPVAVLEGDPHFWLDPRALATVAEEVRDRLVEIDPGNAEAYRADAAQLVDELADLDRRFAAGLEDCERRTVVTSHEAFGYLGYRYDLRLESVAGISPDSEASPRHLADLADLVRAEGITTVFTERLVDPALAETLSDELGLRIDVLDPIEGLSGDTADEDYLSLMEADLAALRDANGCR